MPAEVRGSSGIYKNHDEMEFEKIKLAYDTLLTRIGQGSATKSVSVYNQGDEKVLFTSMGLFVG